MSRTDVVGPTTGGKVTRAGTVWRVALESQIMISNHNPLLRTRRRCIKEAGAMTRRVMVAGVGSKRLEYIRHLY